MHPVSGLFNFDQTKVADGFYARIVLGHRGKALRSPKQERGRSDLSKNLDRVLNVVAVRREGADIVIKLPHQRTVGIPVRTMERELASDVIGESRLKFLHPRHGCLQVRGAVRNPLFDTAHVLDPGAPLLRCRTMDAMSRGTSTAVT